ncbi:sugar phosphate isomerase/epimerase family protein [Rathayibacter tanaceti]|uniref:Inosose dehydratase n=2 Tax=Rathayibacter tanaceti TaxID=1671680 RepID=A0A166HI79_9MICO|nr:sugar phosphate isomerase/epimerase [Rathayibacter tanaceti]KZX20635.1 Inosose dehydratase [Rathayibacter tanaceti]QHC54267.1 TIM barrel protein [Rathayibacter tanaceti]TCO37945.1 inosose dehydratase [Rathayibacter tanaceti]
MRASVAGAPVSFGVFELTPEGADVVGPDELVDILAETGYTGIDLGPVGYLGRGAELRGRLDRTGLDLAGGWIQLPFSDHEAFTAALPALHETLRIFAEASERGPGRLPLPTFADDGSDTRRASPGRGADTDPLDAQRWSILVANVERAVELTRAAGFEPTFHHHAGTFIESPDEIDRFLGALDIGLTLDTGHLVIAGGDPLLALERWGERINHLHLKDVDLAELERVLAAGGGMREVWSSGSFVAFGRGDIDLAAVMTEVDRTDYDGWIVVEQDVLNAPDAVIAEFRDERSADQRINREALRDWV